ncbi:2805_t:CDS:2, partial [Gigaspora margarita]
MICRSPVKRGRKALTVSEGHIDVTGRTHIMTVKRSTPLTPKKKTRCEQNDEFIDILSERLDKLESLTQKIVDVTKQNDPIIPEAVNFSAMEIDDLIEFSNHLDVLLFKKADIP